MTDGTHTQPDASVYLHVAARHGPLVAVFPPSERAFDLHHFMRHYNFQAPDHHTGEMLLAGYIHEKPLGLEVRGNGFAETHSMALEGAFYRVDFAGLSFIAVVAPRGGDVGCIHLESNHFGAPAFYPCSLSGDSHSSALPTAIRDDDSALPASAVYFRA